MKLKEKNIDLKSSIDVMGKYVTQIIHFADGEKRTIKHIQTDTIQQGQMTKFMAGDNRLIMVNDNRVNMIEVFGEE